MSSTTAAYTVVVSNAGGDVTSSAAQLHLKASENQAIYESLYVGNGSFSLSWNLNLAGAQMSGTNYLSAYRTSISQSPLTRGPQSVVQGPSSRSRAGTRGPATCSSRVARAIDRCAFRGWRASDLALSGTGGPSARFPPHGKRGDGASTREAFRGDGAGAGSVGAIAATAGGGQGGSGRPGGAGGI